MKTFLLLLLVYTNMGFTIADNTDLPQGHIPPSFLPETSEPQGIIVNAPDNCRIIFR